MKFRIETITGAALRPAPMATLEKGALQFRLVDASGAAVAGASIQFHLGFGGGQLLIQDPSVTFPSKITSPIVETQTDADGKVDSPEWVLGPEASPNALIVQSDHAIHRQVLHSDISQIRIVFDSPLPADREVLADDDTEVLLRVVDAGRGNKPIPNYPLELEVVSGASTFLINHEAWGHYDIRRTLEDGTLRVDLRPSRRDEIVTLRARSYLHAAAPTDLRLTMRTPTLLSWGGASIPAIGTGSVLEPIRFEVSDSQDMVLSPDDNFVYGPMVHAKEPGGRLELEPPITGGVREVANFMAHSVQPGPYRVELSMPDFPDSNHYFLSGQTNAPHNGQVPATSSLGTLSSGFGTYISATGGGDNDAVHQLQTSVQSGAIQYLGPNATSGPIALNVSVQTPPAAGYPRLVEARFRFKLRLSPYNSTVDDPNAGADFVSGTLSENSTGPGADEVEITIPGNPGPQVAQVFFLSNEFNHDQMVEITAEATMEDLDSNGNLIRYDEDTALLSQVAILRPRMYFSSEQSGDIKPILGEGIRPVTLYNPDGTEQAPDPARKFFVELRCHDVGQEIECFVQNRTRRVKLRQASVTPSHVLYRSDACYLVADDLNHGGDVAPNAPGVEFFRVTQVPEIRAWITDQMPGNNRLPELVTYFTAERPVNILGLCRAGDPASESSPPPPRISFNLPQNLTLVARVDAGSLKATLQGRVWDCLADIGLTPPVEVLIDGTSYSLNGVAETTSFGRPNAWRGDFSAEVPVRFGLQHIEVKVVNAEGVESIRTIAIDVTENNGAIRAPASIKAVAEPQPWVPDMRLPFVHYLYFAGTDANPVPASVLATIESYATYPDPTVLASRALTLTKRAGTAVHYHSSVFMAVRESTSSAVQLLPYPAFGRVGWRANTLPNLAGPMALSSRRNTQDIDFEIEIMDDQGNWVVAERVIAGQKFRLVADTRPDFPDPVIGTSVSIVSSTNARFSGSDRTAYVELERSSAGRFEQARHLGPSFSTVQADHAVLLADYGEAPNTPPDVLVLRLSHHGNIMVGEATGSMDPALLKPALILPQRAEISAGTEMGCEGTTAPVGRLGFLESVVPGSSEVVMVNTGPESRASEDGIAMGHNYRSGSLFDGPFGPGWNGGWQSMLWAPDDLTIKVLRGSGIVITFILNAAGEWESQPGCYAKLEKETAGWLIHWSGGIRETFLKLSSALPDLWVLHRRESATPNPGGLLFGAHGLPLAARDGFGRDRQIRWKPEAGRVVGLGNHAGDLWKFSYHPAGSTEGHEGNLASVRSPVVTHADNPFLQGRMEAYGYDPTKPRHLLGSLQDPAGQAANQTPLVRFEYHADGRIHKQVTPTGEFVFDVASLAPIGFQLTVTDRKSNTQTLDFDTSPGNGLTQLPIGESVTVNGQTLTNLLFYNTQRELEELRQPMGNASYFEYDEQNTDPRARGNLLRSYKTPDPVRSKRVSRTMGITDFDANPLSGDITELSESWLYEPEYQHVISSQDVFGQETISAYDGPHLTQVTMPMVTFRVAGQAPAPRVSAFRWSNYGQMLKSIDENGVVTRMWYFPLNDPFGVNGGTPVSSETVQCGLLATKQVDVSDSSVTRNASLEPVGTITTEYTYDRRGNRTTETTASRTMTTAYNELGEVIQTTGPEGEIVRIHYDHNRRATNRYQHISDLSMPTDFTTTVTPKVIRDHMEYDREGQLTELVIDADGKAIKSTYKYDANGNLELEETPREHDVSDPVAGAVTKFEYDEADRLVKERRGFGTSDEILIRFDYTDNHELLAEIQPGGRVRTSLIDGFGRQIGVEDPEGNRLITLVDDIGRLTHEVVEGSIDGMPGNRGILGEKIYYYDEGGREIGTREKGFQWKPDGSGGYNRTDIGQGARVTARWHDAAGNPTRERSPNNVLIEAKFDGHRNMIRRWDSLGNGEVRVFDEHNQVTQNTVDDALGQTVIAYAYDKSGRVIQETRNGDVSMRSWYDTGSSQRLREDGLGNRIETIFDGAGEAVATRQHMYEHGRRVNTNGTFNNLMDVFESTSQFDANGNLKYTTDYGGVTVESFDYNAVDVVTTRSLPDDAFPGTTPPRDNNPTAESYSFTYTSGGLIDKVTDPRGAIITHSYDGRGQLEKIEASGTSQPGPDKTEYVRDGAGRIVEVSESRGSTLLSRVKRRYTSFGDIWYESQDQNYSSTSTSHEVTADHTTTGLRSRLDYPGGAYSIHTPPNIYGNTGAVNDNLSGHQFVDYRFDGPYLRYALFANGLRWGFGYDSDKEVVQIRTFTGNDFNDDDNMITGTHYHINEVGMADVETDLKAETFSTLEYDSMYRLEGRIDGYEVDDPTDEPESGRWWSYDARGIPRFVQGGTVRDRNAAGQLLINVQYDSQSVSNDAGQIGQRRLTDLTWSSGVSNVDEQFVYDATGNLIRDAYQGYEYDFRNRLVRVTPFNPFPDDPSSTVNPPQDYAYDGFNRLIRTDGSTLVWWLNQLIEEHGDSNNFLRRFFHSADDRYVGYESDESGSLKRFYVHSARDGSAGFLTDATGAIVERYGQNVFGQPRIMDEDGDDQDVADRTGQPLIMHNHYYDPKSRLHFAGLRAYHPFIGRFMQRDPGGSLKDPLARGNPYAYAGNNSSNLQDDGHLAWAAPIVVALLYILVTFVIAIIETSIEYGFHLALGKKKPFHPFYSMLRNFSVGYATNWIPGALAARFGVRGGRLIAIFAVHLLAASGLEYGIERALGRDKSFLGILAGNIIGALLFGLVRIPAAELRRRVGNWLFMKRNGLTPDTLVYRSQPRELGYSDPSRSGNILLTHHGMPNAWAVANWDQNFLPQFWRFITLGIKNKFQGKRFTDPPSIGRHENILPVPIEARGLLIRMLDRAGPDAPPLSGVNATPPGSMIYLPTSDQTVGMMIRLRDVLDTNGRLFQDRNASYPGLQMYMTFDGHIPARIVHVGPP